VTRTRIIPALMAATVVVTACGGNGSIPEEAVPATIEARAGACTPDPVAFSESSVVSSGLDWLRGGQFPPDFGEVLLVRQRIVPVLAADGIPAIDEPRCLPVAGVGFLTDNAPVVALDVNGDARAYPLEILTWHELVNDTVGGLPITISYCPLCNSAIAYDRRVGDRVLDFGTSGALTQSSMVMYDRQTETLWTHFDGRAVAGELVGERLSFFSTSVVSWGDFRAAFPDGKVLSRDTGFSRDYGRNPYPGYEGAPDPFARFITDEIDPTLPAKVRVIGVEGQAATTAILHSRLFELGVVAFDLDGRRLVAFNRPGTASAVEGALVSGGDDLGASGVFVAEVDAEPLTFSRTDDGFVDAETGSSWNIFGLATAGELTGAQLEPVPHLDTFWFAWSTFHPDTAIAL
jgi:hypothetical protein